MASDLMKKSAKLAKRLAAIPAEIVAQVRPALVQGADDLADMARALVPEEEGDLNASVAVIPPGAVTPAYAEGGGRRVAAENQALVTVGNPQARHGHLVGFGTDPHLNGGQCLAPSRHDWNGVPTGRAGGTGPLSAQARPVACLPFCRDRGRQAGAHMGWFGRKNERPNPGATLAPAPPSR